MQDIYPTNVRPVMTHRTHALLIAMTMAGVALAGCIQDGDGPEARAETAIELSQDRIAALVAVFDDQPLSDSQSPWPEHRLKWVSEDTFIGIHFDHGDPSAANAINWIAIGKKGVFCSEDRPGPEEQWRHFHSYDAPSYPAGHGGDPGAAGYWLLHIAVRELEAPWGDVKPGVDTQFMRTPAPDCGAELTTFRAVADHGGEGDGEGLDQDEVRAIVEAMPDDPLSDSQSPWPEHRLLWVSEDTFIGTHWNHADPLQATELNWLAVGIIGTFCDATRPGDADHWRHFHSHDAHEYGAGHGGDAGETGYWTLHAAVRDFEAPWGEVTPGVDSGFMHTRAPDC